MWLDVPFTSQEGSDPPEWADAAYAVVVPQAESTPTAPQIEAGQNASGGAPLWANSGKIFNIGAGLVIHMKGPSGLPVDTACKACLVEKYADLTYGPTYTCNFTTLEAGPQIANQSPSNGWHLAAISSNIVIVCDQPIAAGSGLFTLTNTTLGTLVETFNIATGVGSAGGSIAISGNTLTINPNANLTARNHYAVTAPASAIRNVSGTLTWDGLIGLSAYTFQAAYALPMAKTLLGARDGFAQYSYDNSLEIKNSLDAADDFSGIWIGGGKITLTGDPTNPVNPERGARITSANHAKMLTSMFNYQNSGMTVLVELCAKDFDADAGTNIISNSPVGFSKVTGNANSGQNYFCISKSDSSTRQHNIGLALRGVSNNQTETGAEIANPPTGRSSRFPRGDVFGVLGLTHDGTSMTVADHLYSVTKTGINVPPNLLEFYWGPVNTNFYYDIRATAVFPVSMTAAELIAEVVATRGILGYA